MILETAAGGSPNASHGERPFCKALFVKEKN